LTWKKVFCAPQNGIGKIRFDRDRKTGDPMTTDLVMIGAGGTCADVLAIVDAINRVALRYRCIGVLDDNPGLAGGTSHGLPVLGPLAPSSVSSGARLIDCLGSPRSHTERENLLRSKGLLDLRFETLVAPSAFVARDAQIGEGCIIYPNTVIMAGVRLGRHVTVLANCVLNHHATVGDFSIITSGVNISGRVSIGKACYIGAGASLIHDLAVGDRALVGLGAAVIRDVPPDTVVAGNPATVLRRNTANS